MTAPLPLAIIATSLLLLTVPSDGNMAIYKVPDTTPSLVVRPESDYGSDLDDTTVNDLLSQADSQPRGAAQNSIVTSIEDPVLQDVPSPVQRALRFARTRIQDATGATVASVSPTLKRTYNGPLREPLVEIEYDEQNRVAFSRTHAVYALAFGITG